LNRGRTGGNRDNDRDLDDDDDGYEGAGIVADDDEY